MILVSFASAGCSEGSYSFRCDGNTVTEGHCSKVWTPLLVPFSLSFIQQKTLKNMCRIYNVMLQQIINMVLVKTGYSEEHFVVVFLTLVLIHSQVHVGSYVFLVPSVKNCNVLFHSNKDKRRKKNQFIGL